MNWDYISTIIKPMLEGAQTTIFVSARNCAIGTPRVRGNVSNAEPVQTAGLDCTHIRLCDAWDTIAFASTIFLFRPAVTSGHRGISGL